MKIKKLIININLSNDFGSLERSVNFYNALFGIITFLLPLIIFLIKDFF
jgi:hypothetical protein